MDSVYYQENRTGKSIFGRLIKVVFLLLISLGLYLFARDFPIYMVFEPQSTGWVFWVSYANNLILPFGFYFFLCLGERWLKTWQVRALIAFASPNPCEVWANALLSPFVGGLYWHLRSVGYFDGTHCRWSGSANRTHGPR
jgi:hypothetical protein